MYTHPRTNRQALCYAGTLNASEVAGKIVFCERGVSTRVSKSVEVQRAGGIGMVLLNMPEWSDDSTVADLVRLDTKCSSLRNAAVAHRTWRRRLQPRAPSELRPAQRAAGSLTETAPPAVPSPVSPRARPQHPIPTMHIDKASPLAEA